MILALMFANKITYQNQNLVQYHYYIHIIYYNNAAAAVAVAAATVTIST